MKYLSSHQFVLRRPCGAGSLQLRGSSMNTVHVSYPLTQFTAPQQGLSVEGCQVLRAIKDSFAQCHSRTRLMSGQILIGGPRNVVISHHFRRLVQEYVKPVSGDQVAHNLDWVQGIAFVSQTSLQALD